jgi:hypothetical protein
MGAGFRREMMAAALQTFEWGMASPVCVSGRKNWELLLPSNPPTVDSRSKFLRLARQGDPYDQRVAGG